MDLLLKRRYNGTSYTIGSLYIDDVYECDTIEDVNRGLKDSMSPAEITSKKVYGKTAIPSGKYEITMDTVSPKFKSRDWARFCSGKLPRLLNVKGYEGVLIHVGNTAEDSLGCILVGENKVKGKVINSTATFKDLYYKMYKAKLAGEKIYITIV